MGGEQRGSAGGTGQRGTGSGKGAPGRKQAYVLAAAMLDSWAFRPVCLSPLWVSARRVRVSEGMVWQGGAGMPRRTHHHDGGLHFGGRCLALASFPPSCWCCWFPRGMVCKGEIRSERWRFEGLREAPKLRPRLCVGLVSCCGRPGSSSRWDGGMPEKFRTRTHPSSWGSRINTASSFRDFQGELRLSRAPHLHDPDHDL